MKIKIDEAMVAKQIAKQMEESVSSAIGSYEIKKTLIEAVATEPLVDALGAAVSKATENIDLAGLTEALAEEMARVTTAVIMRSLIASSARMIVDIGHPDAYGSAKDELVKAATAKLERAK